jgi:hypothetical protein
LPILLNNVAVNSSFGAHLRPIGEKRDLLICAMSLGASLALYPLFAIFSKVRGEKNIPMPSKGRRMTFRVMHRKAEAGFGPVTAGGDEGSAK